MRIDDALQALQVFRRSRAVEAHRTLDAEETRTYAFGCAEETAQVEFAFELNRYVIQRNAQSVGMQPVGDFLAGGQSRQCVLDRIGRAILTAQRRRFIHFDLEFPYLDPAVQSVLALAGGIEADDRLRAVICQRGAGSVKQLSEASHELFPCRITGNVKCITVAA